MGGEGQGTENNMDEFSKLKKRFKNKSVRPETEVSVEQYLYRKVRRIGYRAVKFEDPSYDGAPDRLILGPNRFVEFVETKRPKGGRLSPAQKQYHVGLKSNGYDIHLICTKEEVDAYCNYLSGLKEEFVI